MKILLSHPVSPGNKATLSSSHLASANPHVAASFSSKSPPCTFHSTPAPNTTAPSKFISLVSQTISNRNHGAQTLLNTGSSFGNRSQTGASPKGSLSLSRSQIPSLAIQTGLTTPGYTTRLGHAFSPQPTRSPRIVHVVTRYGPVVNGYVSPGSAALIARRKWISPHYTTNVRRNVDRGELEIMGCGLFVGAPNISPRVTRRGGVIHF